MVWNKRNLWHLPFPATCSSHLTVVVIHYGCASIAYLKPKSESSVEKDLLLSVTYTIITPLLNPVVYSLLICPAVFISKQQHQLAPAFAAYCFAL